MILLRIENWPPDPKERRGPEEIIQWKRALAKALRDAVLGAGMIAASVENDVIVTIGGEQVLEVPRKMVIVVDPLDASGVTPANMTDLVADGLGEKAVEFLADGWDIRLMVGFDADEGEEFEFSTMHN